MNWYNFIFSEKKPDRIRRHLLFWVLWWVYFSISFFHYEQSGLKKIEFEPWNFPFLIKSFLLLSVHIAACYYFINYLLPNYLLKGRYTGLALQVCALAILILLINYFIYKTIVAGVYNAFSYTTSVVNHNIWWTSITSGLLSAPKIISAAAAIKLLKRWWLKQKEKERFEKEKLITELQLLKAQMHPEFLFSSLNNIGIQVQRKDTGKASILLLKLADILSYMLYESDSLYVPLEREIKTIKDFLLLKKTSMGSRLEIDIGEKGKINGQMIAPLILLPFIEDSFSYIGNKKLEKNWINLEFHVNNMEFTMRLIHGKTIDRQSSSCNGDLISNTTKRLEYFYPGQYELKTTVEPEIMMTSLKISLNEFVEDEKTNYKEPLIYDAV